MLLDPARRTIFEFELFLVSHQKTLGESEVYERIEHVLVINWYIIQLKRFYKNLIETHIIRREERLI